MTVYAKHYVRIAGRTYTPGELIEYSLPSVDIDYLVKKGAIIVDETEVLPADENGPEIVFTPMQETAEPAEPVVDDEDILDDIVAAPVKKKTTRKKG